MNVLVDLFMIVRGVVSWFMCGFDVGRSGSYLNIEFWVIGLWVGWL